MNGIHDMGGMQGMGAIEYAKMEPVFHAAWEARVELHELRAGSSSLEETFLRLTADPTGTLEASA